MMQRRKWFQFSLRSFLLVVTAACLWLGWHVRPVDQNEAVAAIEEMGGLVRWDLGENGQPAGVFFITHLIVGGPGFADSPKVRKTTILTDSGLKYVACLPTVRYLVLESVPITDAGLRRIYGLKNLRYIGVLGTDVSAAGIAELQKVLPACEIHYVASRPQMASAATISN
jgi:hypothetical protein